MTIWLQIILIIFAALVICMAYNKLRKQKIKKAEYEVAFKEMQLMNLFLKNQERIKRWKAIQFKCQFFASAYKDDKKSKVPEIADTVDKKLAECISSRLDEAFAIKDDEYCQAAAFDSIAEFMATMGQFERAKKLIDLIKIETIRNSALEKYKELEIRYSTLN